MHLSVSYIKIVIEMLMPDRNHELLIQVRNHLTSGGFSNPTLFGRPNADESRGCFMLFELLGLLMNSKLSMASFSAWFWRLQLKRLLAWGRVSGVTGVLR